MISISKNVDFNSEWKQFRSIHDCKNFLKAFGGTEDTLLNECGSIDRLNSNERSVAREKWIHVCQSNNQCSSDEFKILNPIQLRTIFFPQSDFSALFFWQSGRIWSKFVLLRYFQNVYNFEIMICYSPRFKMQKEKSKT